MSNEPRTFRKNPVEIQTMQWTGTAEGATPVIQWVLSGDQTARYHEGRWLPSGPRPEDNTWDPEHLQIDTLEGTMRADVGDWIIRGIKGEFYPCKPDIFAATYSEVSR